jgi:hypothetical protein
MSKAALVLVNTRTDSALDWGHYTENSVGTAYTALHTLPGSAAAENTALNTSYRAYDRTVTVFPRFGSGGSIHVWQGEKIFTLEGTFLLKHTVTGMQNVLDFGVHTGLYVVADPTGHVYVCGLYPGANAGETGWVKWDQRTDTWTSGIITGTTKPTGNRMSPCVVYQGELVHTTNGVATFFDPVLERVRQVTYADGSILDRPVVVSDRLMIVSTGGAQIRVREIYGGGGASWADLGQHAMSAGGDFALMRFAGASFPNRFYVMWYTSSGGLGARCSKVDVPVGTGAPTITDTTAMVPTSASRVTPLLPENLQWPSGNAGQSGYSWECTADNVDNYPFGAFAEVITLTKVIRAPLLVPGAMNRNSVAFNYTGDATAMVEALAGVGTTDVSHRLSSNSTWLGGSDRRHDANRPNLSLLSATAYSDAGVSRGLLLTFLMHLNHQDTYSLQVFYEHGDNTAHRLATLDGGTPALDYGGTASFNAGLNRVDDLNPEDTFNNRTTLLHGVVTAGPFEFGAAILGGTSGATAVVQITTADALYVNSVAGGPFTPGETLTQTNLPNAGANAVLSSQEDRVEHQIVWDLDADSVPEDSWVTIQIQAFNAAPPLDVANPGVPEDGVWHAGHTPSVNTFSQISAATPITTQSGAVQPFLPVSPQTPITTQSGAGQIALPPSPLTPTTTQSGAGQITLPPSPLTPITTQSGAVPVSPERTPFMAALSGPTGSEPVTESGGIAIRNDGTPVGTPRDTINLISTPGMTPRVADDATPGFEKSDIGWDASAEVLLVPPITGQDLVAGIGTLALVPPLGGATRYLISKVQVIPESVDGAPGVQPTLRLETPAAVGDHAPLLPLVVAGDNYQEMGTGGLLVTPRPMLDSSAPNNRLNVVQVGLATATNYTVTFLVWGYVLTP